MNGRKFALSLLSALVLAGSPCLGQTASPPPTPQAQLSSAIASIKPCVVLLEVERPQGHGFGTGFLVSSEGHIVTNDHVVRNAQSVTVYYLNKEKHRAQIVKKRPQDDLALLKITRQEKFPTVTLGSDQTTSGTLIGVTGYPLPPLMIREGLALDSSSISGIVSGQRQTDGSSSLAKVVTQIDAIISGGNSGSPVYTSDGLVVGVACSGVAGSSLNFAVPVSRVKSLLIDAGVVPQLNPVGESMTVAPGDLSALNTVPGNKTLHPLFGSQSQLPIDSRQTNDRQFARSHAIFQAALGHAPSLTTPLVAAGNKIQFGALDGTLYEYDTTYQELRDIAQSDNPFYFYPVSNGKKVCIASGFLIPDKEISTGGMVANVLLLPVFATDIHVVKGFGQLMAVEPSSGSVEWVVQTRFLSQPSIAGNTVYAGSLGSLSAYNLDDGREVWQVKQDGPGGDTHWFTPANSDGQSVASLVVPVRVEGTSELLGRSKAYVASYDAANGAQKWKQELDSQGNWERPMAGAAFADLSQDRLFVVHCDKLYAFVASTGKPLWSNPFTTRSNPKETGKDKLGPYFSPGIAISGDTVMIGCENKNLYAISASTGQQLWVRATNGKVGQPTVVGGTVYVGSTDKYLYALDAASGSVRWKYNCQGSVMGRPIVMGQRVYCSSDNGSFHAIRIPQ